ncbi:MAG: co-chaperone HscB [Thalassotalea sp.]
MNYFELFGVDESFDIDSQYLSQVYQSLQKKVHPDKFAHAASQTQLLAVQKSAQINDAYQTLKLPLKRAQYMLEQRGVEMPPEQNSFQDNMFLMRQMELREMLEDVKHAADPDAAILSANQELDQEYQQLLALMHQQLIENSAQSNKSACDNLRKLKFYQKLHIELDRLEDQLFDD